MELRKNESIFRVGAWNLAYWKAPWLLKALGGTATIEQIAEQARKDYPGTDFTKSLLPALKRLSRGDLVNRKPIARLNYDKSWTLLEEPSIDGKCHTCKR
ncbi:hypothetical protein [Nitrososphaera sp.]|uniref:hypothetical protein n=1 Tax=Nitrososphaera sp. TaxID=1971748 RepID=UPI001856D3C3|nr:hypothetical protein [Nitrososphaera sp.]NWG37835.1 hypothetical protein [Nitrososphaera sp.]